MLRIRPATPDDVPAIMALEKSAITAAHWSPEQYQAVFSSASRVALIAEENASVQGFLIARCGIEWEIENVVVAEPALKHGVGTQLVGKLLDLARGHRVETVLLEVRETNTAARALYEKFHFVENGRRRKYYRDPEEDAILYTIRLT